MPCFAPREPAHRPLRTPTNRLARRAPRQHMLRVACRLRHADATYLHNAALHDPARNSRTFWRRNAWSPPSFGSSSQRKPAAKSKRPTIHGASVSYFLPSRRSLPTWMLASRGAATPRRTSKPFGAGRRDRCFHQDNGRESGHL